MEMLVVIVPALIILLVFLSSAIKILREYERGVIFRLGRLIGAKGPGIILLIPVVDRMVRVSLRTIANGRPTPGRHHARQRVSQGQRGDLLPRH
jgi:regulator of protease activity HflC (stomatin/prohibitin superfamily)